MHPQHTSSVGYQRKDTSVTPRQTQRLADFALAGFGGCGVCINQSVSQKHYRTVAAESFTHVRHRVSVPLSTGPIMPSGPCRGPALQACADFDVTALLNSTQPTERCGVTGQCCSSHANLVKLHRVVVLASQNAAEKTAAAVLDRAGLREMPSIFAHTLEIPLEVPPLLQTLWH
jgi:hypothetical protein